MASLLGKADSTIAGMSYRQAMADVMPDYSDIYKAKADAFEENQLGFQKVVSDYFDIKHADNNKLADELKEATTKAMQGLGTDYETMELFNSHLTSMKERMKALPKDKKGDFERAKIRAEMNQLLESSFGLDDTLAKVGTMIEADEFFKHTTDYPALLAISKGEATKEIIDGNLVYTYKDDQGKQQTIDRQGIEDALGQSDLGMQSNFIKLGAGAFELGKQGGRFNRNKSINSYEDTFTTPAGLAANMNQKQGGLEYTFVESLAGKDGSESIYKALTNMGPTTIAFYDKSGPGGEKDGKITEADFASPENGIALIESLTDPRSKNYNFQAAKRAAAEFYADKIDQVEFNDGKALRPTDKTKGLNLSYGFRTWGQMKNQYDQINAGQDIIKGLDGTIWNKQKNGTYKLNNGEDVRTPNQLKDHFELNHLDSFVEPKGGYGDDNIDVNVEGQETPVTQILQHDGDPNKTYNMGTMVGNKSFSDLFSGDVDDDDVAKMLQAAFPNLKIIAPFNVKEKIRVNNREFNVKDKSDMARLLEYLNSDKIQKLISPQPNTEFNSTIQ